MIPISDDCMIANYSAGMHVMYPVLTRYHCYDQASEAFIQLMKIWPNRHHPCPLLYLLLKQGHFASLHLVKDSSL